MWKAAVNPYEQAHEKAEAGKVDFVPGIQGRNKYGMPELFPRKFPVIMTK